MLPQLNAMDSFSGTRAFAGIAAGWGAASGLASAISAAFTAAAVGAKMGTLATVGMAAIEGAAIVGTTVGLAAPVAVGLAPIAIGAATGLAVYKGPEIVSTAVKGTAEAIDWTIREACAAVVGTTVFVVSAFKKAPKQGSKTKPKDTTHEVDAFSSDSTEVMVDSTYDFCNDSAVKSKESEPNGDEDEEEEEKKRCIMTENVVPSDLDNSDDEDFERRTRIVLVRKSTIGNGTINGSYHLVRRLTRYLRVAGMVHYVQITYKNSQLEVFQTGPSQTKDQTCHIENHHASHVVQLQVSPSIDSSGLIYIVLRSYLGHTHCVHQSFNLRIGKEIDSLQKSLFGTLLSINWAKEKADNLSPAASRVLTSIKDAWLGLIRKAINSGTYPVEQLRELNKAYRFINAMNLKYLYSKTQVGPVYVHKEFEKLLDELKKQIKQEKK